MQFHRAYAQLFGEDCRIRIREFVLYSKGTNDLLYILIFDYLRVFTFGFVNFKVQQKSLFYILATQFSNSSYNSSSIFYTSN